MKRTETEMTGTNRVQGVPTYSSPALSGVARGALCAGCGGCALVAPEMIAMSVQAPGYLRPVQSGPLSYTEEQRIAAICPGLGQNADAGAGEDYPMWGAFFAMRTGHAPSAPLAGLEQHLDSETRFAFVGKPCDVAALRTLSRPDDRVAERVPVMVSFFCAGVPSLAGAEKVLESLGTSLPDTAAFRYRGHRWPGAATATLSDDSTRSMSYHDSWGKILSKHVQHWCKICADGSGVAADVVCADAWESDEAGYPVFEERDGTSLIVSRTALGEQIVKDAIAAGHLETEDFDVSDLAAIQPGQSNRRKSLLARLAGLALCGRPIPRYTGLHILQVARQNSMKSNAINFLGMVRSVVQGRIG